MTNKPGNILNDAIAKEAFERLAELENGQVTITVQNSRIVQVETAEKKRFDELWRIESLPLRRAPLEAGIVYDPNVDRPFRAKEL